MLLFIDESGHDNSGTPCEVVAGVANVAGFEPIFTEKRNHQAAPCFGSPHPPLSSSPDHQVPLPGASRIIVILEQLEGRPRSNATDGWARICRFS